MKILKYVLLTYILITGICLAAEMTIQTIFFGTMDRENPPMMYGSGTKILESNPGIGIETYQLLEKKIN
ncbi:MAG: hypothetical protein GY699_18015, partial [Desulfobacteraceae bacterium]|nr:hypothetical protein [Desulfobacteraceae bacterium]